MGAVIAAATDFVVVAIEVRQLAGNTVVSAGIVTIRGRKHGHPLP